ncbi:MAG: LCP family protein, partial [Lachnospiraceae bacterium]|nr:LCP family protein [Lachnospiraceae bacterium]
MSDTDNEEIIEIETVHEKRVRIPDEKQIESFGRVKVSWIAAGVLAAAAIVLTAWVAVSYFGRDDTYAAEKVKDVVTEETDPKEPMESVEDTGKTTEETNTLNYREIHSLDDFGDEKWNEGNLMYKGEIYSYDPELQTYLFMGIDNDHMVGPAVDGYSGGQSDGMFLMVVDKTDQKVDIVAINRNTVVPVDVYDEDGSFLARKDYQICIQHGYGDGMKLSCMRSVEAVQRLFRDIPIAGYLSLNMGGLPAVNDAVGG